MSHPSVSVLIAAYGAEATIGRALGSVARQTVSDWEIIVVDDGSRDHTVSVVEDFARRVGQRVRCERFPANRGVSAARNRLLQLAQGEMLAFLDADDYWKAEHLGSILRSRATGAGLIVSGIEIRRGDNGEWISGSLQELPGDPIQALFRESIIQTSSSVALSREIARQVGDFDGRLQIGEDRDYWLRSLLAGAIPRATGKLTCCYTKNVGSAMTRTHRVAADAVAFYRKHVGCPGISRALARRCLAEALAVQARMLRQAEPTRAARQFAEAWRLGPHRLAYLGWAAAALVTGIAQPFRHGVPSHANRR